MQPTKAARARSPRRWPGSRLSARRFVAPDALVEIVPAVDRGRALAGRPADVDGRAAHPSRRRPGDQRSRGGVPPLQGADRCGDRDEGQVDDDRADRRIFCAARLDHARRRKHRQPADQRSARRDAGRLGGRRGLVVPARDDPVVQAARCRAPQHHARSSRPLSFDGRVRRSEVSHLRQPVMGDRFVGNLDDPRVAAAHWRRGHAHSGAAAVVRARTHREQATMHMRDARC